jgi:hypothetical protein
MSALIEASRIIALDSSDQIAGTVRHFQMIKINNIYDIYIYIYISERNKPTY